MGSNEGQHWRLMSETIERDPPPRTSEPIYLLVRATVVPALSMWFRWRLSGLEHIPRSGGALIACNHISYLDPLIVARAVVRAGRRPRFLAKSELFADRRIAWALRGAGQIEVKRGTAQASEALEHARAALEGGEVVVMFPEGTVTTDPDLEPMAPRSGTGRLAAASGAKIIPCAVWGTANVWPKGRYRSRWWPGQRVAVAFGAPLAAETESDDPEGWRSLGVRTMAAIAELVEGARQGIPDRRRARP